MRVAPKILMGTFYKLQQLPLWVLVDLLPPGMSGPGGGWQPTSCADIPTHVHPLLFFRFMRGGSGSQTEGKGDTAALIEQNLSALFNVVEVPLPTMDRGLLAWLLLVTPSDCPF